jgi:hypothetical protein
MRLRSKLLFAGLAAAALLAAAVTLASANRLAVSEQQFRQIFTNLRFEAAGHNVNCAVTLEGSFHSRTMAKVLESLIGYVTLASVTACTGGTARVLSESLPWHIHYLGFGGTLPIITSVKLGLAGAAFRIETSAGSCLTQTSDAHLAVGIVNVEAGVVTELRVEERTGIPLGGLCVFLGEGHFFGTSTVTNGAGGSVSVTLVA